MNIFELHLDFVFLYIFKIYIFFLIYLFVGYLSMGMFIVRFYSISLV